MIPPPLGIGSDANPHDLFDVQIRRARWRTHRVHHASLRAHAKGHADQRSDSSRGASLRAESVESNATQARLVNGRSGVDLRESDDMATHLTNGRMLESLISEGGARYCAFGSVVMVYTETDPNRETLSSAA